MSIGRKNSRLQLYDVKCPYFRQWTSTSVTCESIMDGVLSIRLTFPREYEQANFARENCCQIAPHCEIYRLLNEKYQK